MAQGKENQVHKPGKAKQKKPQEHSQHQAPQSRLRATVLLSFFCMVISGIILAAVLYSVGKLPIFVLNFAGAIVGIITAIGILLGLIEGRMLDATPIRDFFRNIWQNAYRLLSVIMGLLVALAISGAFLFTSASLGPSGVAATP